MFTGIVSAVGSVDTVESNGERLKLTIRAPYDDLQPGESIAVNGACLTVVETTPGTFSVEAIRTTRDRTNLGELTVGNAVNLERAVAVGERFGGHFVQGHVDGVARVVRVGKHEDALLVDLEVPKDVAATTVPRGSIAVDGVSFTVNEMIEPNVVQISLIPFTADNTTLGSLSVGDNVHVEADMLGKLVQRLLENRSEL